MSNREHIYIGALTESALVRAMFHILLLLLLIFTACARRQYSQPPAPLVIKPVTADTEAIAIVLAYIQQRGGDPSREECSVKKMDGEWWVTAWHIWYPKEVGSSRFVPGGFTVYAVSTDGKIIRTMPGL